MDLEGLSELNRMKINSNRDYLELNFKLKQLELISDNILNYLSSPKRNFSEKSLLVTSEQINSNYLKNLAETIEYLENELYEHQEQNTPQNFVEYINSPWASTRYNDLLMYSSYLKSRKNPKLLNTNELKRIKRHPLRVEGFQLEIKEKTYQNINNFLDNTLPKIIIFPFKSIYRGLSSLKDGVDKFFDKYKIQEDGQIPDSILKKLY
jgi:hypothetical protein